MRKNLCLTGLLAILPAFFPGLGIKAAGLPVPPVNLVVNTALCFSAMDNNPLYDEDVIPGQITVTSLLIQNGGSINYNDPGNPCSDAGVPNDPAKPIKIIVLGNMEMQAGGVINTENKFQAGNGGNITITVGGTFIMQGPNTEIPGALITSSNLSATSGGKSAGDITIYVIGDVNLHPGSVIKANANGAEAAQGPAGAIEITSGNNIDIDGSVLSESDQSGSGNVETQPPGGGTIFIVANHNLFVSDEGIIRSKGQDAGADLVHLCGCSVIIYGLVESSGSGHAIPANPPNHLHAPGRPDKPANSTAGVEVWSGSNLTIDNLNHNGVIKADLCCSGGANGKSWIDLFARGTINIIGKTDPYNNSLAVSNFAVHANGASGNTDDGGIITIKSINSSITATGLAVQADGTEFGGSVTIEATNAVTLNNASVFARGDYLYNGGNGKGGHIAVRSFLNTISWQNGACDVRPTGTLASLPLADRGDIIFKKCFAPAVNVTGTSFPYNGPAATTPFTQTDECTGSPDLPHGPEQNTYVVFCECRAESCVCIQCGEQGNVITVDQNVTINLGPLVPTYSGDPDLLPYFSWDKTGLTADTWRAIFNLGSKKLLVKNGATITVSIINGYAPGITVNSTCELEIENGGHIVVNSQNKNAGNIIFNINGHIIINGEIRDEVSGTLGLPGAITLTSSCGNITIGSTGQVFDLGVDPGGNTITLQTCGGCFDGDITVNGLVKAYAHAHAGDLTLNRPTIKVNADKGAVTINGNTANPLYDEFQINGSKYDIWGGLLAWVRDNVNPGKVEVQAKNDITVNGHGDDPSPPVRTSFGAIASIATASNAPGGLVDVRSTEGNIIGNDRAFDVSGRNRLTTNFAHINLMAALNISINRLGANSSFNPVVDASSPGPGDKGGKNDLRSYTGNITIGTNALVSAAVPAGGGSVQGTNNLVSCVGVFNNGTIVPADLIPGDNSGVCGQFNPPHLFSNPCQTATRGGNENQGSNEVVVVPEKTILLQAYPNPFTNMTTIRYSLEDAGDVQLKVFDITGREVTTLVNGQQMKGEHRLQWNASGLPGGAYVVQLKAGNYVGISKIVVLK